MNFNTICIIWSKQTIAFCVLEMKWILKFFSFCKLEQQTREKWMEIYSNVNLLCREKKMLHISFVK